MPAKIYEQPQPRRGRARARPSVRLCFAAVCCPTLLAACTGEEPAPVTLTGRTMGTTYSVKLYAQDGAVDSAQLRSRVDALLERVNDLMSTWRPDSELSRFNRSRSTEWFAVSPETARVVEAAQATSALSGGAFDATVGPVVNVWGFGPEGASARPPSEEQIRAAMASVGYRHLRVRTSPPALRKTRPDLYVDLSAIAKGYGVDALAELLDRQNLTSYLVEIGGELRARGTKPDGSPWKIAVERPVPGERTVQNVVALRDSAIATSGDYRNYVEKDGERLSHTIDPRTGRPVEHALASVSVIDASAMRADALATAIMVMGPERGYRFAERESLAVELIVRGGGEPRVLTTPPFEARLLR